MSDVPGQSGHALPEQLRQICAITGCEQMQQAAPLLDHLVGAGEQRWRHSDAERLRGLEIDCQLVLGRRLYRQVGWLLALENAIDVRCRTPMHVYKIRPV